MAELLSINPDNIDSRKIKECVRLLNKGEVIIIPTDSIYALACDINQKRSIEEICRLLNKRFNKANLSILCESLSRLSQFTLPISTPIYKLMNRLLPGPFTFILKASSEVPKIFRSNKKTIGIRVPDNAIVQAIIEELGRPLVSSSIHAEDEIQKYLTEPEEIFEEWHLKVPLIVDGGIGQNEGSTVIDCTIEPAEVIRAGLRFSQV
jgi:tRNA threonylcarbamoyl adenosine modification protein (Sua5/YciO/YrdC/YwlC family)